MSDQINYTELPERVDLTTPLGATYEFDEPENDEPEPVVDNPYTLELSRNAQRSLNEAKIKEQIDYIIGRIHGGNRGGKWTTSYKLLAPTHNSLTRTTTYTVKIDCEPTFITSKTDDEFVAITAIVEKAAGSQKWILVKSGADILVQSDRELSKLVVPEDWMNGHFAHVYGRQDQIEIVMSGIEAGIQSDFENRFHCVLYGPPACGKTEIAKCFANMFGEDAVIQYDATATTQAGAIKDLASREVMPQLLIIEEIEKTDENSLRWLLSVLDHRAEIRKVNARVDIQKEVKLMCLATVNDFDLFQKLMYGALASRFTHKIFCPRPNEEILKMILTREIKRVEGGKMEWIEPAIKYAERYNINDPRQVTAICLCGRDELMTGMYQKKLQRCARPTDILDETK